jgi:hypothetical protein
LLHVVYGLLPHSAQVLVVGDQEFGGVEVLRQLEQCGWRYVFRQTGKHLIRHTPDDPWQTFRQSIQHAGQSLWMGIMYLTQKHESPTNLLAHWACGEKEPWLLATNLPSRLATLRVYQRRMWINETFGKKVIKNGWRHFVDRLDR